MKKNQDIINVVIGGRHAGRENSILNKALELNEENAVLKKALELACEDLSLYENITSGTYKAWRYIEQAKESMNEKRNKV